MRSVSAWASVSLRPRRAAISSSRLARRRSTSAALASACSRWRRGSSMSFRMPAERAWVPSGVGGEAAIDVGGLGFGLLTLAEGIVHVLADAGGAGGEKRAGVLADEVSPEAGEGQE